ncbi:dynamin family protein [Nostoc sp. CMAA1605]|uniref:dynamin family protein n=1 Tax=Nostoc sp. CMAA1605 TaxID=2055159 RepID=UPI001F161589|nr:dynamin family protein [Nostoc sp. CMAA1605]MCF4965791.1 dynamin family protein [Nostoc sp. CMAA1605]
MDTSLIGNQVVNFLSNITGQKMTQKDVTPPVLFLANLIVVLLGVILIDGSVTEKEKQRLVELLYRFSTPESDIRKLTHLMIKGIRKYQLYRKFNELLAITHPLSKAERLLLIGFGYEMSTINGRMGLREQRYLEIVAQYLDVKPQHLAVLASAFKPPDNFDIEVLNEVDDLLNPSHFQALNPIVSLQLPSEDLINLSADAHTQISNPRVYVYYEGLKNFQEFSKHLENYCHQVLQIIQTCNQRGFLSNDSDKLVDKAREVLERVRSHKFRLAVVGEFSQGKSTLLNALLGEEIQPMREIPCSGTVVVLKYGERKRVVCRYKDGREEEIPFEEYRQQASISEEAAIGSLNEELIQSTIEDIIVEHPNLTLCNSGVEIIDSPGLNENPELTAITQKLLHDIDAAIFVTNASRSLTQGERELLNQLRIKLNGGKDKEPASNLFIVGNFMDLVRTEKGREQIQKRILNLVEGDNPIITGKNRVHFLSAQTALNAILNNTEDEYQENFDIFIKSIERFLMLERGGLKLYQLSDKLNKIIQEITDHLLHFKDDLESEINIVEDEKHKILERIGEFSGRDVKICLLTIQLIEQALEKASVSWNEWYEGLDERMVFRSEHWHSEHRLLWNQDKLIRDYIQCFVRDLSNEVDEWVNTHLKNVVLKENLQNLNINIKYELEAIQSEFNLLDIRSNTTFSEELKLSINDITDQLIELDSIDFSAALKEEVLVFTGIGFIPFALANITSVIASSFGSRMLDSDRLHSQIKTSVLEIGFQKFDESIDKIYEKLQENIERFFDTKVEAVSRVIEGAISVYEKILEQQERSHQEMLEQHYATKSWIMNKCQELEEISNKISTDIATWNSEVINKVIIKREYD